MVEINRKGSRYPLRTSNDLSISTRLFISQQPIFISNHTNAACLNAVLNNTLGVMGESEVTPSEQPLPDPIAIKDFMMKINPCASLKLLACILLIIAVSSCESPKKEDANNAKPAPAKVPEQVVYVEKPPEFVPPPVMDFVPDAPSPQAIQMYKGLRAKPRDQC